MFVLLKFEAFWNVIFSKKRRAELRGTKSRPLEELGGLYRSARRSAVETCHYPRHHRARALRRAPVREIVLLVVNPHNQRIVLTVEETTMTQ